MHTFINTTECNYVINYYLFIFLVSLLLPRSRDFKICALFCWQSNFYFCPRVFCSLNFFTMIFLGFFGNLKYLLNILKHFLQRNNNFVTSFFWILNVFSYKIWQRCIEKFVHSKLLSIHLLFYFVSSKVLSFFFTVERKF